MKKLMTAALVLSLAGSAAFAGGLDVVVEEGQPTVVTERPSSSAAAIPLILGAVVLCAVACGGDGT